MFEIRSAGPKGLGVFAKSLIPRGTRIFSEKPLLSLHPAQSSSDIYTLSRLLPSSDRKELLSLSSHMTSSLKLMRWNQVLFYTIKSLFKSFSHPPFTNTNSMKEHVTILSIFRSNAFDVGTKGIYQAVFAGISRINHNCVPNAQGNWNEQIQRFNVHATRDIGEGEEVSLSYLGDVAAVREVRSGKLREGYGFECGCQACNLDSEGGKRGEERRLEVRKMLGEYSEGVGRGEKSVEGELGVMMRFIGMLEKEGIAGREVASMYLVAARLNGELGMTEEVSRCAARAEELDQACLGVDHETYLATKEVGRELMTRDRKLE